jgi:hypothetical protein
MNKFCPMPGCRLDQCNPITALPNSVSQASGHRGRETAPADPPGPSLRRNIAAVAAVTMKEAEARMRADHRTELDELREQRNQWQEQAQRALLTFQGVQQQATPPKPPERRRGCFLCSAEHPDWTVLFPPAKGRSQGKCMKVCDPMFGADFGELAAPEPCLAEQKTRFQSRL